MPRPSIAIAHPSGPIRAALKTILGDALASSAQSKGRVIGLAIPVQSDGSDWPDQAGEILARHPNCIGLLVAGTDSPPLDSFRPALRSAFEEGIHFTNPSTDEPLLKSICFSASRLRKSPRVPQVMNRVREMVKARILYRRVEGFGHGATKDITNQVLAPLRVLVDAGGKPKLPAEWKKEAATLIKSFREQVIAHCDPDWHLSHALKRAFKELRKEPWQQSPVNHFQKLGRSLETVMDLLTHCRTLAGEASTSSNSTSMPVEELPATLRGKHKFPFEVLVIDDHAQAWRPVFERLQQDIRKGQDGIAVRFSFLTGGECENAETNLAKLHEHLAGSDAVLLDIRLNHDLNGLQILRDARRHHVNCPIIIWTSSRAAELPAEARLAHGFLFKKTTSFREMADLLKEQLRSGNAKRRFPLPGHFFDHSIMRRANRKTAQRFTEYCSKQLDSFHALDERYFRFFTDHGGRHILKLLDYLEAFIRPLVRDPAVFSQDDDAEREEEVLALYLAVFLHEFGMLRLKGENEPNWDALHPDEAARENTLIRNLHAIRGMVMLADPSLTHWPDEEGQYQARKRLHAEGSESLVSSVAILTGYHSRLLPLDVKPDDFCKWSVDIRRKLGEKAAAGLLSAECLGTEDKAEAGLKRISSRFFSQRRVSASMSWSRKQIEEDRRKRLMKHCALFRFADAIDVDHTRNPADFLALSSSVSSIDLREALKRQVVRQVHIDGGKVSFWTCVPKPDSAVLERILKAPFSIPDNPWDGDWILARIKDTRKHQRTLDDWLADFWRNPQCIARKFGLKLQSNGKLDKTSKLAIASLTALSVAWEVADEYGAIIQCKLADVIRLSSFEWRETCPAKKREAMLSMLFHPNGLDRLCL